ncbi:MAG: hypothetical protein E7067_01405 [Lentimicrobiaceae bacterium]|nr:hypothetical protein [Lentimicrobiaceae bacterium]
MNKLAQFISVIAHPIFLPTWMFLILVSSGLCNIYNTNITIVFSTIFVTTFVIPMIFMFILKKVGVIKSITMERREDRFIPLIIMVIFLYTTQTLFRDITALGFFNFFIVCNIILCSIVFWINIYWKISLHAIGCGSFVSIIFILTSISAEIFLPYLFASIIISGVVGSARLYLKSHSASQVYTGFAVGFIIVLIIYSILW